MKTLLVALLAIAPMTALAEGGERFPEYYPPSNEAPRGCVEGQKELFIETDETSGNDVRVWRVCHNGSFYKATAPVRHRGCKEGSKEIFIETDLTSGNDIRVIKTCRNGVWK